MLNYAQKRIWGILHPQGLQIRRFLATETSLSPSSINEPSPEFAAALKERQLRRGIYEEKVQPTLSDEEQQAEYDDFLERQEQIKPQRMHLSVDIDPNHGFWAFFRQVKKDDRMQYETIEPTVSELLSGRAWTAAELRRRSFMDLHKLWYIVLRERNLLATQKHEAKRLQIAKSAIQASYRDRECKLTMNRIKQVLNERRRAFEEACDKRRTANAEVEARSQPKISTKGPSELPISNKFEGYSKLTGLRQIRGRSRRRFVTRPNTIDIARANAFRLTQPAITENSPAAIDSVNTPSPSQNTLPTSETTQP